MAISRHPLIAREGWPVIFLALLLVVSIQYFTTIYAAFLWLIPVLLIWIYRDPGRNLCSAPLAILSPVDGNVIISEPHSDPYLGRDAYLFRLSISILDVYAIRSMTEGKIIQQWLNNKTHKDNASLAHAIQIQTDEGDDVVIVLRPGRFFNRLSCDAIIGERIGQGYRYGFIPLGTHVDVYVPKNSIITASKGDKVIAGISILASFKHHS